MFSIKCHFLHLRVKNPNVTLEVLRDAGRRVCERKCAGPARHEQDSAKRKA
jgi:hypothetical protein